MQIKLNLKIFIFALFFLLNLEPRIYIYLMIFALIHEMGHMLVGILLGFKPESLQVMPLGFSVSFKVDTSNYNQRLLKANLLSLKKAVIAFAGPLVNFVIFMFTRDAVVAYVNLLICMFNLVPVYPLDGGRIVKEVLCLLVGRRKAVSVTHVVSNIFIVILLIVTLDIVYYTKNIAYIFVMIYIILMTIKENKKYKLTKKMYKILENYCNK